MNNQDEYPGSRYEGMAGKRGWENKILIRFHNTSKYSLVTSEEEVISKLLFFLQDWHMDGLHVWFDPVVTQLGNFCGVL